MGRSCFFELTGNLPQKGGQVVGPETRPNRAALMATLSGPFDALKHVCNLGVFGFHVSYCMCGVVHLESESLQRTLLPVRNYVPVLFSLIGTLLGAMVGPMVPCLYDLVV